MKIRTNLILACVFVLSGVPVRGQPAAAKAFAARGLDLADEDGLKPDIAVLTEGDSILARFLRNLAESVRNLPVRDVATFRDMLGPAGGKVFETAVAVLKKREPGKPPPGVGALILAAWRAGLRDGVRAALQALAR